ncbi:hypothetical protein C8R45DRAFT_1063287 [Mycena sanguinolenta]|nr:hypothetical protein C8R45DRAFT_1063287 [Mycena sanguinolenta]
MPRDTTNSVKKRGPPSYHVRFANISAEEASQGLRKEQQSQYEAAALMASHGLDLDSREDNGNRWSVRWSTSNEGGKTRRVLLQCDCGYDHCVAGSKKQHTAVDFTGCLAHAEVTFVIDTQKILRVRGFLEHNEACKTALMQRIPALPLHPSVYQTALIQLANGVSLTDIQQRNREWVANGGDGLIPKHGKDWKHRWLLQRYDTRSLYRQFSRLHGVKLSEKPHINLDEWLDPKSPQFNSTLASAIFHYSPRTTKEERLEMKEAAWKYGYQSQIVVDGTFGVCDSRLLLFIVMGIDEDKKGVPLAFLLFSAPTGNQLSSSGYDTDILAKLLKLWRVSLETFRGGKYLKERGALIRVFPGVFLLICKFHLRQSWRNHRNKLVKGRSAESLEERLVSTTTLASAITIIEDERRTSHGAPAERGLLHLEYLLTYWLSFDLWASWSDFGRYTAAKILGCDFDGSFNGLLKRKYLRRWQRGGRRLRVDVLILPARIEKDRIAEWILSLPGGNSLLRTKTNPTKDLPPIAYFMPDASRDAAALQLLQNHQISVPTFDAGTFSFTCYSSHATEFDAIPQKYEVEIRTNGTASCSGPDFSKNGGACKHIRAGLLKLSELRHQIPDIPIIYLPTSQQEAHILQARLTLHSSQTIAALQSSPNATVVAAQNINDLLVDGVAFTSSAEDSSSDEGDEVEDDTESVATDTSGDGDELMVDNFIHRHSGTSAIAIDAQAIARVSFELSRHAPKIRELGDCLRNVAAVQSESQRLHLASFRDPLSSLVSQLERLSISVPTHTLPIAKHAVPRTPPPTHTSSLPIPPSPERRRQERHDSYSCH